MPDLFDAQYPLFMLLQLLFRSLLAHLNYIESGYCHSYRPLYLLAFPCVLFASGWREKETAVDGVRRSMSGRCEFSPGSAASAGRANSRAGALWAGAQRSQGLIRESPGDAFSLRSQTDRQEPRSLFRDCVHEWVWLFALVGRVLGYGALAGRTCLVQSCGEGFACTVGCGARCDRVGHCGRGHLSAGRRRRCGVAGRADVPLSAVSASASPLTSLPAARCSAAGAGGGRSSV